MYTIIRLVVKETAFIANSVKTNVRCLAPWSIFFLNIVYINTDSGYNERFIQCRMVFVKPELTVCLMCS